MGEQPALPEGLDSWKEIAAYLKRDVTTVQRWEKVEGLPVHRHLHRTRGSVYAYREELEAWLLRRQPPESDEKPRAISVPRWRRRKSLIVLGSALVLAIAVLAVRYSAPLDFSSTEVPVIRSLAVLPLADQSGVPDQEHFAAAMTDALITNLASFQGFHVISRPSVMRYKNTVLPLPHIARELGVEAIVEGSVLSDGSRMRINVRLVHAATDRHLWAKSYERDVQDVIALQQEVSQAIAREIGATVGAGRRASGDPPRPGNPAAYDAYWRGRYYRGRGSPADITRAIEYFHRAIDIDPSFAGAYSGLADCYAGLSTVAMGQSPSELRPRARAAARRALELDPGLSEAHASLASVQMFDWEWELAEQSFVRAIEAAPGNSTAHGGYAHLLAARRRFDEAIAEARLAETLDPLSPQAVTTTAYVLILARQPDKARQKLETALTLDPQAMTARWRLGSLYAQTGRYDEAIATLSLAAEGPPPNYLFVAYLAYAYGRAGKRDDADRLIRRLLAASDQRYVSPSLITVAYLGVGDRDRTFEWLERAYEERSNFMAFLDVFPFFDPMRDDPRLRNLVQRVFSESDRQAPPHITVPRDEKNQKQIDAASRQR